jgi:hypothetical protein
MPNWKKVIVSGSNATLNHITASGNISASGTLQGINFYASTATTRVGASAGYNNTGNTQTAIGYQAGHSNEGNYQIAIGYQAGDANTGNYQTAIGYQAGKGNSGDNLVAIGYAAGYPNTLDNQFIVKHSLASATPLIQGNFQSGSIGIGLALPQANLHVSGNIWASGSNGNITASANISASGTITANSFVGDGSSLTGVNNYVLPTDLAGDSPSINTGALTGATVISNLDINITTNTSGLVTDANASVATRTLTAANLSLGNVTNESKATMFTSPTFTGTVTIPTGGSIIAPTGLVKGDVGLGNVDNTSNATERAAAATLTNKTLTTPIISSISNTGTLTLPTSTDTLVGRATTDTLTNKTLRRTVEEKTSNYTLVAADAGKVILLTTSGIDVTIPANVFTAGDEFTIINDSQSPTIGACTITVATGAKAFIVATQYQLGASFSLGSRRGLKFICTTGGASSRFYGWRS